MNRRTIGAATAAFCLAFLAASLCWVGDARAAHDAGKKCYDCHDLSGVNVESGTHLISRGVMAESRNHGWTKGMRLGCSFCHRSVNVTSSMPDVLTGFIDNTPSSSRHPVTRNFTTGAYENTAYLSTDNTTTAGHLDCKDCHDLALASYPSHNANWLNNVGSAGQTKATNPFALKGVTAPKAYDGLCRNCHRSAAAFTAFTGKAISVVTAPKLVLVSHDNAVDNTTNAIRDLDNTILKPQNQWANNRTCSMCHDAHNSSVSHLYNDGHENDWLGVPETAINENVDCTTICHFRGDAQGSYDTHGHGKAANWNSVPLSRACTSCHDISKPHAPASGVYENRYRFPSLDNTWKTLSAFGKPVKSVCAQCHSTKDVHATAKGAVGCLDCHDQHAKNSDNNVMMIRNTNRVAGSLIAGMTAGVGYTIGSEPVLFAKSPKYPSGLNYDFFTNTSYLGDTSAGFCDQRACHGAGANGGVSYIPMDNYVRLSGKHSGGNQAANTTNCESCHSHQDPAGSFRATSACTTCHGSPPPPADSSAGAVYPRSEALSPHLVHAAPASGVGYGIVCRACHANYTDSAYHNTATKTFQSVFFDNTVKRGVSAYDNIAFGCTNITCHSDGRGGNPVTLPTWFTGIGGQVTLGCTDCHRGSTATALPMLTGAHPKHLAEGQTCSSCHVTTVADDNVTIVGKSVHTDNVRTVAIKGAYDNDATPGNNWNSVAGTCSGVTCHGNNVVNWTTDIGKISCQNCHVGTGDVDDFGTGTAASIYGNSVTAVIDNTEWLYSGHGKDAGTYDCTVNLAPNLVGASTGKNKCKFCHDDTVAHGNVANPFRLANTNWNSLGMDGNCYICHSGIVGKTAVGYQPPQDNATLTYTLKTSASFVADDHYNWTGSNVSNSRHTGIYNGGNFCWDCHDPHGDRSNATTGNIVMIGKMVSAQTDNILGIPAGGTAGAGRRTATFTKNATGADYATGGAPYQGICETCHIAASGVTHYYNTGVGTAHNPTTKCIGCHAHDTGFKGGGGSNQEQFFDNAYRADNTVNYKDMSGHRILSNTTVAGLFDGTQVNCYDCHGVYSTGRYANECLKCHWENRTAGTPAHPNGIFEWATPGTPATQSAAYPSGPVDNTAGDAMCTQCHGTGGGTALNGVAAPIIIPVGEAVWGSTTTSGHGTTTTKLSSYSNAGPPAYKCADCHKSSATQADGLAPGFHASMNDKLIRNDNILVHEYPSPLDTDTRYDTLNERSAQMDNFCSTKCHRNLTNGLAKDDNVIDHSWDLLGGQTRSGAQSHPTDFLVTPGAYYKNSTLLPYSNYTSGALPGAGNVVCVTCHNPHGGGVVGAIGATIKDSVGTNITGGGKNMLRLSPADNVSTICKECHK